MFPYYRPENIYNAATTTEKCCCVLISTIQEEFLTILLYIKKKQVRIESAFEMVTKATTIIESFANKKTASDVGINYPKQMPPIPYALYLTTE